MSDLPNLRKFVTPEIIFGCGARKLAGNYARRFMANKVLIVTDPGVIAAGWLDDVQHSLEEVKLPYHVFSSVTPNPRTEEVMEGAEVYRSEACDVIVSVGGGSPMDCAKGIGIVSSHNRDILDFEGVDRIGLPVPPLILVPTTAGTSADVSQFCIISNRKELVKIAIVSKAIVPDVALIDPQTTHTMDPYLTACTGVDALVHAIEAFVSIGSGPMTDDYALDAIRLIHQNLPAVLQDQQNAGLREKIMLASMKAGLAFSNAILGAVHAMAHSLGGFLDLPHGECNALLIEHVIDYNFEHAKERYMAIAQAIGLDLRGLRSRQIRQALINDLVTLKNQVGITGQLRHRGVKSADIPLLSGKAVRDACMLTNPRTASAADVAVIYAEAM